MMSRLFSSREKAKCYILYWFEFERSKVVLLYDFLPKYFREKCNVEFKFGSFYDEKYVVKYGKIERINADILKSKWDEIAHLAFDDADMRKNERKVRVEFTVSRPNSLFIFMPTDFNFDYGDFVRHFSVLFQIIYGFSYIVELNEWSAAYAFGDWQHLRKIDGINRLSKNDLQRWLDNCEKIQNGYLRDVYNENILHQKHLEMLVNEKSLKQCILKNDMGTLEPINQELSFWKLDDRQLKTARDYLYKLEIII